MILDPNALDAQGGISIDFWAPSPDGTRVAVSLSSGGSEDGELHLYDVATGKELGEPIPHVNYGTAGGSVAWLPDGRSFLYTRYPAPGERPPEDVHFWQQVWRHRIGTPVGQDVPELTEGLPRIAEIAFRTTRDARWIVADVRNGDGGEHAFYVREGDGKWAQASRFEDRLVDAAPGEDGNLYLLSVRALRGRVLRVPLASPELGRAQVLVPEGEPAIQQVHVTRARLYTVDEVGGPMQIRAFGLDGTPAGTVPLEPVAAVTGLARVGSGDDLLVEQSTYLSPPAWARYDAGNGRVQRTALFQTSIADFSDAEVVRELATSRDGTHVPMSIVRKKGTQLDGRNPVLLYGYGGYGISTVPHFSTVIRAWLDQGGVWVDASIRGGAEYGEGWHLAGNLVHKQNVFDDFDACARRLFRLDYTRPSRLAALGGSNGGLLMGAALTQHPEPLPGGRRPGRHLRHDPRRGHAQRSLQRDRVRDREEPGPGQGAPRLLAVPPRGAGRPLPRGAAHDRRQRSPRRPLALAEVRGAAPGGRHLRASHPPADHRPRRPRGGERARRGHRRAGRLPLLPLPRAGHAVAGAVGCGRGMTSVP